MPLLDISKYTKGLLETKEIPDTARLTEKLNQNSSADAGLLAKSVQIADRTVKDFGALGQKRQDELLRFISSDFTGSSVTNMKDIQNMQLGREPQSEEFEAAKLKQEPIATEVISGVLNRLGADTDKHLLEFAKIVRHVESNDNANAQNPNSTAKGHYQYINSSVKPAINRAKRFYKDETPKWLLELEQHKDVRKLTKQQATDLFIADISEKKGTDSLLKRIITGDRDAMRELYEKYHHTKPDKATKKRWNKIAGIT